MKKILISSVFVIIATVAIITYLAAQPLSIEHLKKHPEDFRFEYFKRNMEMQIALESVIPLGMTEDRVDEIFVDHIGTSKSEYKKRPGRVRYSKSNLFIKFMQGINSGVQEYHAIIFYDKDSRVKKVCALSSTCPYNKKGEN